MQAQARRIGGQHQDVQGVHGLVGDRRENHEPIPDLHGLFTSMNRIYRILVANRLAPNSDLKRIPRLG